MPGIVTRGSRPDTLHLNITMQRHMVARIEAMAARLNLKRGGFGYALRCCVEAGLERIESESCFTDLRKTTSYEMTWLRQKLRKLGHTPEEVALVESTLIEVGFPVAKTRPYAKWLLTACQELRQNTQAHMPQRAELLLMICSRHKHEYNRLQREARKEADGRRTDSTP